MNDNEKKLEGYRKILKKEKAKFNFRAGSKNEKMFNDIVSGMSLSSLSKKYKLEGNRVLLSALHFVKRVDGTHKKIRTVADRIVSQNENEAHSPITSSKDMSRYIPRNDGYIARRFHGTSDVSLMHKAYEQKHFILLVGETGAGKTHLARDLAYKNKVPYMRVNLNGATTPEDLVGQWIPNPNSDSDAKYVWQDGVLTEFMKYGGIFVVDEINMAPADILSLFHSITDDERRLVLTQKDGEVIVANPDFFLVATMNPDYEGTKPLNLALKDRFRILHIDYSNSVEKKLGVDSKMLQIANQLRKSDEIATPVSTRDLIKYTVDKKLYGEAIARVFFVNNFDSIEKPVVKEVIDLTLGKATGDEDNENGA